MGRATRPERHSEVPMPSHREAALALALCALATLPPAARAAGAPGEAGSSGAFVITVGRATIGLERFTRTAGSAEGTLVYLPAGLRFDYSLSLLPDGSVRRMENAMRKATAPASAPTQGATLEWKADSVIAEITPGGIQRIASQAGSMPYLNPSVLMLELVLKRAGSSTPPSASVPVFAITGGQTIAAGLQSLAPDTVAVALGSGVIKLAIDSQGHVLSGSVAAQGVRFQRVDSLSHAQLAVLPPDYSAPAGAPYTAETVRVPTRGGFELVGTLTRPI